MNKKYTDTIIKKIIKEWNKKPTTARQFFLDNKNILVYLNQHKSVSKLFNQWRKLGYQINVYDANKLKKILPCYGKKVKEIKSVEEIEFIKNERQLLKYQDKTKVTNKKYKQALQHIELLEKKNEILQKFNNFKVKRINIKPKKTNSNYSESTANIIFSDWHIEEYVDPNTVNYLNEYNLDIAKKRAETIVKSGQRLIDIQRSGDRIETLVLALLGDFISGYIHDELIEENQLSPTEALLFVYELLINAINFYLKNGKFKKIYIPCCIGNHGRTEKKYKIASAHKNSYEWLLYNFLQKEFRNESKIEFIISDSYHLYMKQYDFDVRFHHGNSLRYGGGIGGLTIPVNKAIGQWNKARKVDYDVFGHFHTSMDMKHFVSNGSLVGYNAFALSIKADFEKPSQQFFLINNKRGKTVNCQIFAD